MINNFNRYFLLIAMSFLMCNCGTVINGFYQDVTINTNPSSASVELSDGQKCTTPCTISLDRSQQVSYKIEKAGCKTVSGELLTRIIEGDQGFFSKSSWYGSIDYEIGTVFDFFPNPLNVKMYCDNQTTESVKPSADNK